MLVLVLEGDGLGDAAYTAAFTRIPGVGEVFWWFFPSTSGVSRPILLFLGSVTGVPHSFLLNFGEIGPLDFDLNVRNDSLVGIHHQIYNSISGLEYNYILVSFQVNDYSLLFVDGIVGTGFSKSEQNHDAVDIDEIGKLFVFYGYSRMYVAKIYRQL